MGEILEILSDIWYAIKFNHIRMFGGKVGFRACVDSLRDCYREAATASERAEIVRTAQIIDIIFDIEIAVILTTAMAILRWCL